MSDAENKLIYAFEKNSAESVRIHLSHWRDSVYCDIRIWQRLRPGDGEAWQPTKKGITLNVEFLSELREGISKAIAEVELGRQPMSELGERPDSEGEPF